MIFLSKAMSKVLGVYIDVTLSVVKHIDHIIRLAYLEIRRFRSVRHLLTSESHCSADVFFCSVLWPNCNSLLIEITSDQMYHLPKK